MKLKMKIVAVAAAMMAATAAHADFASGSTGNSTMGLLVWNTSTSAYYLRDVSFTLSTFLPNNGASVTASADAAVSTFDKTPEAGLTLDKTTTANFADSAFATWLGSQNTADIRWTVMADDRNGTTSTNRFRQIGAIASGSSFASITNGQLDNGSLAINGLAQTFAGISTTGTLTLAQSTAANGSFIGQNGFTSLLGGVADLYYWVRSAATGSTTVAATQDRFGNSANFATISLASNGDLTYTLAPAAQVAAVPLPAAAWLLGSGLLGIGGMVRRRKAAAQA